MYMVSITLEENNVEPYPIYSTFYFFNIDRLRKIIYKSKTAKVMYYVIVINLFLIAMCILALAIMVIFDL